MHPFRIIFLLHMPLVFLRLTQCTITLFISYFKIIFQSSFVVSFDSRIWLLFLKSKCKFLLLSCNYLPFLSMVIINIILKIYNLFCRIFWTWLSAPSPSVSWIPIYFHSPSVLLPERKEKSVKTQQNVWTKGKLLPLTGREDALPFSVDSHSSIFADNWELSL